MPNVINSWKVVRLQIGVHLKYKHVHKSQVLNYAYLIVLVTLVYGINHPLKDHASITPNALILSLHLTKNAKQHHHSAQLMGIITLQLLHALKHSHKQVVLLELMENADGCQQLNQFPQAANPTQIAQLLKEKQNNNAHLEDLVVLLMVNFALKDQLALHSLMILVKLALMVNVSAFLQLKRQ